MTCASHRQLHHWVFLIDAQVNDYEEACDEAAGARAPCGERSVGRLTANLTVADMGIEDAPAGWTRATPLVMTPHCHAPSCLREELWNADTGEILCNMTARYGGEAFGEVGRAFNERDYVTMAPCLFGAQPGLQYPFNLTARTNLTAVKYFNNTFRHLGQMAQWTGLLVYDTDAF